MKVVNVKCETCNSQSETKYRMENDKFMCDSCYEKEKPINDELEQYKFYE